MSISLDTIEISRFFLATLLLLGSANLFGYLFYRLKMPKTIGEIVGGLLLGPTVFGYFFPSWYNTIFLAQGKLLALVYWFGLILLMFSSGFEVQRAFNKDDKKAVTVITLLSTIIPFVAAWFLIDWINVAPLLGTHANMMALKLIVASSVAVTSIPVISKIFFELGIIQTRFAKIILGIATIHDIILWVFVTIATSLVSSTVVTPLAMVRYVLITLCFFGFALFIIPHILDFLRRHPIRLVPATYEAGFIVFALLFFVVAASYLNVNLVFGAFLAGVVIGYIRNALFKQIRENIKDVSFAFFVPLYFAIVGIKLDLVHHFDLGLFVLFFVVATILQTISVLAAARWLKYSWLSSFNLAVAMNARGGPGIVIATIAFEGGIISETFFVTLVLLAIVTSLLAGTWLRQVIARGHELLQKST